MANTFLAVLIIIIATVVIVVYNIHKYQNKTKSYGWRQNIFIDLENGEQFDIEPNYSDPWHIIYQDREGNPCVNRMASPMDKGAKDKKLENYWDSEGRWDGFRLVLNHLGVIDKFQMGKIIDQEKEIIHLENMNASLSARVVELENMIEEEFGKKIEMQEKMNTASRKGMVLPKKAQN